MLHVPRNEPGHPETGRALRLDLQPQFRGAPGPRRPHSPDESRARREGGAGGRDHRLETGPAVMLIFAPVSRAFYHWGCVGLIDLCGCERSSPRGAKSLRIGGPMRRLFVPVLAAFAALLAPVAAAQIT